MIPFAKDTPVEVIRGDAKGQRGRVVGPAPTEYRGVRDVEILTETGTKKWLRPDYLRELVVPLPAPSDDDVLGPLRRVRCP